ncbi:MAG: DUF3426 domain-containing protein [Duodenibacillus sp.]
MALVTRCPYCGAVWLLADRKTAEQGPVRCSACRNSFDATREMMLVADAMFPNLPKPSPRGDFVASTAEADRGPTPEAASVAPQIAEPVSVPQVFAAPADTAGTVTPPLEPLAHVAPQPAVEPPAEMPAPKPETPTQPEEPQAPVAAPVPQQARKVPESVEPQSEQPAPQPQDKEEPRPEAAESKAGPKAEDQKPQTAESAPAPALPPAAMTGERCEPHLPDRVPAAPGTMQRTTDIHQIIPAQNNRRPTVVRSVPPKREKRKNGKSGNGWASFLLLLLLLLVLSAVGAVALNQKIMDAFPQTRPVFDEVCGRIPCPGYFLRDPSAFVVSKTTLRNVDESGNYALEITIINGSNVAQGVPHLELELLDDDNGVLLKKTMSPDDYLKDPSATRSLAPNRSLSIRVTMQTNVTPARCTVRAVYPNN